MWATKVHRRLGTMMLRMTCVISFYYSRTHIAEKARYHHAVEVQKRDPFYTETLLHTEAFTHRSFDTQMLLHTEAFTHRCFYTQTLLRTDAFTHKSFYAQKLLHTDAFTHRSSFTHRRFCTQRPDPWNRNFTSVFGDRTSFRAKGLRLTPLHRNFTSVFDVQRPFRAKRLRAD